MLDERIEVMKRACEAWTTRDFDVFRDVYTADVEADGGALWLEQGTVKGVEAVVANYAKIISMFERNDVFPEAFIEAGDTLVVPLLWRGRPPGSDRFIEQSLVCVLGFRGTRISTLTWAADLKQGLDVAGLPESAADSLVPLELPARAQEGPGEAVDSAG